MAGYKKRLDDWFQNNKVPLETRCRRLGQEIVLNQATYCNVPFDEKCIYQSNYLNEEVGKYRCLNIEKIELWKYKNGKK